LSRKYWRVADVNIDEAKFMASEYGLSGAQAVILNSRNIKTKKQIDEFFSSDENLSDPFLIKDMDKAVDTIEDFIESGEKITVFGDYDCDGVSATVILYSYLQAAGALVDYYIPSRLSEGYGMHKESIKKIYENGTKLIITVDNGISALEEAEYIYSLGMKLVVTDHHEPGENLPEAEAVVDPHRKDDKSSKTELCGAGVAFKLCCALDGDESAVSESFSDLAAIASIADVVSLTGETRSIVIRGINSIKLSPRPGISALLKLSSVAPDSIASSSIAFSVAPRVNAAGRLGDADTAFKLLYTDDPEEAMSLAQKLCGFNDERKSEEHRIFTEAVSEIESDYKLKYADVIVASGTNWHTGVIGIVAARLVEKYSRPCIVLSSEDGVSKGSGRSIGGFSLFDALSYCAPVLEKFGGHKLAAGLTIKDSEIENFRNKINEYASKVPDVFPEIDIDMKINPASVNLNLCDAVKALEPFGQDNPDPVFGLYNMKITDVKPLGSSGKHIKIFAEKKGVTVSCLCFNVPLSDFPYDIGDTVDIAVNISKNEYMGNESAQMIVRAVKLASFDDEKYFESESLYRKFRSGKELAVEEKAILRPTRKAVADVYKYIRAHKNTCKSPEFLALETGLSSYETGMISSAVDALTELGLIENHSGKLSAVENVAKKNLASSSILKALGYK